MLPNQNRFLLLAPHDSSDDELNVEQEMEPSALLQQLDLNADNYLDEHGESKVSQTQESTMYSEEESNEGPLSIACSEPSTIAPSLKQQSKRKASTQRQHRYEEQSQRLAISKLLSAAKNPKQVNYDLIQILRQINASIDQFIQDDNRDFLALPPMCSPLRQLFVMLGERHYFLTTKTRGSHKNRCLCLYKNRNAKSPVDIDGALDAVMLEFGVDVKRIEHKRLVVVNVGDVMGEKGKPLDDENAGFRMLKRMGWDPLSSASTKQLGQLPTVTVRSKHAGL